MMTADEVRKRAPLCTAVASELREVFGEAKIERLREGGLDLGKPDENVYAMCRYGADGWPIEERDERLERLLELAGQA